MNRTRTAALVVGLCLVMFASAADLNDDTSRVALRRRLSSSETIRSSESSDGESESGVLAGDGALTSVANPVEIPSRPPEEDEPSLKPGGSAPTLSVSTGVAQVDIPGGVREDEKFSDALPPSPSREASSSPGGLARPARSGSVTRDVLGIISRDGFSDSDSSGDSDSETETGTTSDRGMDEEADDEVIAKEEASFGTFNTVPSTHRKIKKKLKAPGYEEIHHRHSVTIMPLEMCNAVFEGRRRERIEPVARREACMGYLKVRHNYRLCLDLMSLLVAGPKSLTWFDCVKRAHAIQSHWGTDSIESGPKGTARAQSQIALFDKFKADGIDWDALNKVRLDADEGHSRDQARIFDKIYAKLENFNQDLGEKIMYSKQEYLTRTPTHCLHTATLAQYGGRKVVVKRPIVYTEYMYENSLTELYLNENMRMSNVQSDRIVGYYGYFKEYIGSGDIAECPGFMYVGLVFEYMPYSLDRLLNEHRLALLQRPDVVRAIMLQLVQGVRVMQARFGIVHRDIKADNVLMAKVDEDLIPSSINLKFADFDRSLSVNDIPEHYREVGEMTTMTCMPPENLLQTAVQGASPSSLLPVISEISHSKTLGALELLLGEIDTPFYRVGGPKIKDATKAIDKFPSMPHLLKFDVFSVGVIFMELVSGSRYWMYDSFIGGFVENNIFPRELLRRHHLDDRGSVYRSTYNMFLLQMIVLSKAISQANPQATSLYPWHPLESGRDSAHQLTVAAMATTNFHRKPSVFDVARIFGLNAFEALSGMLHFNPAKRSSVTDLMEHPYFTPAYTNIQYTPLGRVEEPYYRQLIHKDVNVMRQVLAMPRSCYPSSSMFNLSPNSLRHEDEDLDILSVTVINVEDRLAIDDYRKRLKREAGNAAYDVHIYGKGSSAPSIQTVVVQIETWKRSIAVRGPKTIIMDRRNCEGEMECPQFLDEEAEWRIQIPVILLSTEPEYVMMRVEIDLDRGEVMCADSAFDWLMVAEWTTASFQDHLVMRLEDFLNPGAKTPHRGRNSAPAGVREDETVKPIQRIPTPTKSRDPTTARLRRESEDNDLTDSEESDDEGPSTSKNSVLRELPPRPTYPPPKPPTVNIRTAEPDPIQQVMDSLEHYHD